MNGARKAFHIGGWPFHIAPNLMERRNLLKYHQNSRSVPYVPVFHMKSYRAPKQWAVGVVGRHPVNVILLLYRDIMVHMEQVEQPNKFNGLGVPYSMEQTA